MSFVNLGSLRPLQEVSL